MIVLQKKHCMITITRTLIICLALIALNACQTKSTGDEKSTLTVSILPQKFFVETLADSLFDVNVMIPRGASPASYEMTPKQMTQLAKSSLYLRIGHIGFEEAWMDRIANNHKNLTIVDLSAGIDLIEGTEEEEEDHSNAGHEEHHHGVDPHIWFSPKTVRKVVENTAAALIRYDQACEQLILKNKEQLLARIDHIDQAMMETVAQLKNRKFVIFHPAMSYLAQDYGLEQISLELEGKEPSVAHFKSVIDQVVAEKIPIIFIQKEFDIAKAQELASETGIKIVQIDPLAEDWFEQMNFVLLSLKDLDLN